MIRVILVDDQRLLREGLRIILNAEPDLEVVGEATNGREAVDLADRLKPDVMLMDIRMPDIDGVQATRELAGRGFRVVLLTTYDQDHLVLDGIKAGAAGYLLKDEPGEEIAAAIRAVHRGEALFKTPSAARALASLAAGAAPRPAAQTAGDDLTAREQEVLKLAAEGLSNGEIARRLVVSEATVKTHINNIFSKLNVRDRVQAVAYAFRTGLAAPGDILPP